MKNFKFFIFGGLTLFFFSLVMPAQASNSDKNQNIAFMGPLTVHHINPRYFSDRHGNPVYLTGSHTWNNFQDIHFVGSENNSVFDYEGYLDFMQKHNHNFMRLWTWEQSSWLASQPKKKAVFHPSLYSRTGPGAALDGDLKFDLLRFNEAYFERLRDRVAQAQERGIYVAVMFFQGFSVEYKPLPSDSFTKRYLRKFLSILNMEFLLDPVNNPWRGHPFNKKNNINGIDGDTDGKYNGKDVHSLHQPPITRLQEYYVKKIIDTLNDFDNVVWEISNESHSESTAWQYHFINFIKTYEKNKEKQHPVLITVQWPNGADYMLFASQAEAVSPGDNNSDNNRYKNSVAEADGKKIIILDTDHLGGIWGNWKWVWKSFLMGMNPIFMDPYLGPLSQDHPTRPEWELLRTNMGYARSYADRVKLEQMTPQSKLASSGYCLADAGSEYLVYVPGGAETSIDLSAAPGELELEWFDPRTGVKLRESPMNGGAWRSFSPPFKDDAILYIYANKASPDELS